MPYFVLVFSQLLYLISRSNVLSIPYRTYFQIQASFICLLLLIIFHHFINLFTCCVYHEYYSQREKKKKKETEKEKTKSMTHLHSRAFRHFRAGPSRQGCDREKKEKKKGKRGRKTYRVTGFMPLAVRRRWSLCALKRVVGRASKSWEGHGWVMHAMWVQAAVVVVKTLRRRGRFGFWPSESGGV